jgi:hypothetical protein
MTQRWVQIPRAFSGANCTLGGQTLINWLATESVDSDYDTASAITIGPAGPFPKGTSLRSIEGGVDTGGWVVEDASKELDGSRTWRSKSGSAMAHIPLVSYSLRRVGYLQARTTLSEDCVGRGAYPPQFCTPDYMTYTILGGQPLTDGSGGTSPGLLTDLAAGKIDQPTVWARKQSWQVVTGAQDMILQIAALAKVNVNFQVGLPGCASNYAPADKPALTAIKEIAAWSGASCWLDHEGVIQVFGWEQAFAGVCQARPGYVLTSETHQNLYSPTHVTVVGTMQGQTWVPPTQGRWVSGRVDPDGTVIPPRYEPPRAGYSAPAGPPTPQCVVVALACPEATYPVNERIQIQDYNITINLAAAMAKERLAYVHLMATASKWSGPGEGHQSLHPLTQNILEVTRRLDWSGSYYKYTLDITGATGPPAFNAPDFWSTTQ